MGTIRRQPDTLDIPTLPIIQKKYIPEAFARILSTFEPPGPFIFVWVMNEDGTPVLNLQQDNFQVGYFGNTVNGYWSNIPIFDFQEVEFNNNKSIYRVGLDPINFQITGLYENMVFSLEVFKNETTDENRMKYRGQCLAYLQPKDVRI